MTPAPSDRAHVLDTRIGTTLPVFRTPQDVAAFEAECPLAQRLAASSTWQALQLGGAIDPAAPAISFLPNADPDEAAQVLSHGEFNRQLVQAGNLFHSLGIGPGGVVSLLLPLVPQAFVALYGAQTVGVANPVNPLLSAAQLAEILKAAGTEVLVALGPSPDSDIWQKVQAIRGQLPALRRVLVVGGAGQADTAADDFDTLRAAQPAEALRSAPAPGPEDTAGCFHTGGTTGTPKLVRHTHANQVSQAWALRLVGLAGPGDAILFGLPLFHVGGALTQGLATLANGGHLVVLSAAGWRHPNALRQVWRLAQRFRPVLLGGVPTVLAAALQAPRDGLDLSSIQRVSGGGSAIPVAVIQAYEAAGWPVLEVYGMTETSSVHTMAYPDMPRTPGAVGRPLPFARTRVVKLDAEGRFAGDCAPGEIGVVAMAGPGVFGGYLMDQHNQGAFVEPGWVNSGDLGRLDAEGLLWITGRAKDLIIRGAHNIDPAPLEELLYRHPAVALAALVGQPDAYAGELPVAYVQRKPGAPASAAELLGYLKTHTPERAAVPVALHFVDPMPLTAVGKIFKPALRADAIVRVATQLLAGVGAPHGACTVELRADASLGQVIRVGLPAPPAGWAAGDPASVAAWRATQQAEVQARLGPLTVRHEVV